VHKVFYRPSTGRYGPTTAKGTPAAARQGHQALALAAVRKLCVLVDIHFLVLCRTDHVAKTGSGQRPRENSKKGHHLCKQGVVPPALVPKVVASLVDELTNPAGAAKAHIDTGANTCSWGVFPTFDV
jgi:hypothetical protein